MRMSSTGWKPRRLTLASLVPGPYPNRISSAESAKLASSGTKLSLPNRRSKSRALATTSSAAPPAQGLHPHQQHEPDSGRRERRAPRGAAGRLGSGLRRDDNNIMSAAADLLTAAELHARLQSVGDQFYHHRHPFHLRMHEGELTRK